MTRQTIGAFLATQRKAHGYTQEEVADRLGISNRTLSKWETDKSSPDLLFLPALAELYGVSVDEILRGERLRQDTAAPPRSAEEQGKRDEQAQRAKRALQRQKLSALSAKSYLSCGLAAVGALLLLFLLFLISVPDAQIACIVLAAVGIALFLAAIFLLIAFRAGAVSSAEEGEGRYLLAAEHIFFRTLRFVLALLFGEAALLCIVGITAFGEDGITACFTGGLCLLGGALSYWLGTAAEQRRARALAEGNAAEAAAANLKLARILTAACCGTLAVLFTAALPLCEWHPAAHETIVAGSAQETAAYMHTLLWTEEDNRYFGSEIPAGEYVLDLQDLPEEAEGYKQVGEYFSACRVADAAVIFPRLAQGGGPVGSAFSIDRIGSTADGTQIYNARYSSRQGIMVQVGGAIWSQETWQLSQTAEGCAVELVTVYHIAGLVSMLYVAASAAAILLCAIVWAVRKKKQRYAV